MRKVPKKSDANTPWNRRKTANKPYAIKSKTLDKTFLIVCEGKNTEPKYFEAFPVVTAEIKVAGIGRSHSALVRETIRIKNEEDNKGREVWCVFDYDYKPGDATIAENFHNALELASRNNIKIGWSNDAIELWFVLHYHYLQNALARHQYYEMLEEIWHLEQRYEEIGKQKLFCSSLYKLLVPYQQIAIQNARRLYEEHSNTHPISKRNPCTTIFMLVEELNKYLKK